MLIEGRGLWLADTNCYVVAAGRGSPCVIVDAPPDVAGIEALVAAHDLIPVALLATHGHVDHAGGGAVATGYGIGAYLHPADEFLALDPASQLRMLFGQPMTELAEAFRFPTGYTALAAGDKLDLAGVSIEVMHTPGHTPGHCCFSVADEGVLFSGDQLFAGSIGRTDLPGGDLPTLVESMRQVLELDDATRVLPGHGPPTSVRRERLTNPFRNLWEG
ncbi:MAG: MBL fold metallo-hydrolase [Actinomycetota bacterium]|nr:MBL fold metallo-hydrolase [Actinomycetota bacterium]